MSHHEEDKLQAEEAQETIKETTERPESAELAEEDLAQVSGGQDTDYQQRRTPGVY